MTLRELNMRPRRARAAAMAPWLVVLSLATAAAGPASLVSAQQSNLVQDPQTNPCAPNFASITAAQTTLTLGESTTLDWTVLVPTNCAMPMLYLRNTATAQSMPVNAVDGIVVQPFMTTTYIVGTLQLNLAQVTVTVPQLTGPTGAPHVVITANNQKALLVQTLAIPDATVIVQDHVEMDLSAYYLAIPIAEGVRLRSGRSGRQLGARLYIRPDAERLHGEPLFRVVGDRVAIGGLRIDGGRYGSSGGRGGIGILADFREDLRIENNEIYGWSRAGVKISGQRGGLEPFWSQGIRDNYFHHNLGSDAGYGVYISDGSRVEITRNVFDANRFALFSGGQPGAEYYAGDNLLLTGTGGFEIQDPGQWVWVNENAFYNDGPAVTLRGSSPGYFAVESNTYFGARSDPYAVPASAMRGNRRVAPEQSACDFDGDGREDLFLTTGQTWWVNNGGDRHWVHVKWSEVMLSDVLLDDVTGDGQCDVHTDTTVLYTTDRYATQSPGTTSRQPQ